LFAITPVLALVAITTLLISRGWPAYSWGVVLILAGFAIASVRIELVRARTAKNADTHRTPSGRRPSAR
jgi:hypothetical protein